MTASAASEDPLGSVREKLKAASAAEDFFMLLGVEYDAKVVNVARLHILKKMGQYLRTEDFDGLADDVIAERCKAVLERTYVEFVTSSPLDHRVFKVLKDAVAPAPKPTNFVPLDVLK